MYIPNSFTRTEYLAPVTRPQIEKACERHEHRADALDTLVGAAAGFVLGGIWGAALLGGACSHDEKDTFGAKLGNYPGNNYMEIDKGVAQRAQSLKFQQGAAAAGTVLGVAGLAVNLLTSGSHLGSLGLGLGAAALGGVWFNRHEAAQENQVFGKALRGYADLALHDNQKKAV